jgi:hypothetical protein
MASVSYHALFQAQEEESDIERVDLAASRSRREVQHYEFQLDQSNTGRRYAFDGQSKAFGRFSFAWLNERELLEAV